MSLKDDVTSMSLLGQLPVSSSSCPVKLKLQSLSTEVKRRFMYQNWPSKLHQLPFDQRVQICSCSSKISGKCTRTDRSAIWRYFAATTPLRLVMITCICHLVIMLYQNIDISHVWKTISLSSPLLAHGWTLRYNFLWMQQCRHFVK